MALIRVAQYNSTPTVVTDYQAQNAHLQAFTNQLMTQQFILDSGTAQPVIKQGCYVSHGGSLYVADADTAITGSPSDGSVYIRVSGTTSLTVEFINDISGYTWNPVYTALTSGSYTLLPYLIVKASTVWTRYNFNPNNQHLGAVTCTSVNTGQGATEVHLMDQNLRTTDSPTFAGVNTGYGANHIFKNSIQSVTAISTYSGSTTTQLSAMDIGEIRFVFFTCNGWSNEVDSYPAYLRTPSGGNFYISPVVGSSTYTPYAERGGSYAGNSNFADFGKSKKNASTGVFIIRRNS